MPMPTDLENAQVDLADVHRRIGAGQTVKPGQLARAEEAIRIAELRSAWQRSEAARAAEQARLDRIDAIGVELATDGVALRDAVDVAERNLTVAVDQARAAVHAYNSRRDSAAHELTELCESGIPSAVVFDQRGSRRGFRSFGGEAYLRCEMSDLVNRSLSAGWPNSGYKFTGVFG
ncbi:MAG: hypothetical protein ACRDZ8_21530 [Acidimicrobiales bacterium]